MSLDKPQEVIDLENIYNVSIHQINNPLFGDLWRVEYEGKPVIFLVYGLSSVYVDFFTLPIALEQFKRKLVSQWN